MIVNDAQTTQYNNEDGLLQKHEQGENIFEERARSREGQIESDVFRDIKIEIKEEAIVDVDEAVRILENCDIDEKSYVKSELTIKEIKADSCDIPSEILNNTKLNSTEIEGGILERRINGDFNAFLERSTNFVEETYKKLLGTSQELRVSVKRENLYELQRLYKGEQFVKRFQRPSYPGRRIRCKMCPFVTTSKYDLLSHIVEIHEELAAEMEIPPLKYIIPGHTPGIVSYKCIDCAYESKRKSHIQRHLLIHKQLHEVETFRCASCPYITKLKVHLVSHMDRHKKEREMLMHICPYCNYTSLHKPSMKNHIRFIHKAHEAESFKCNKCTFKTLHRSAFRKHLILHSDTKKLYKCNLCPFQTVHENVLKYKHLFTHSNERLFNCAHCSYKSKTKETLKKHLLVHRRPEELVKYGCDKCSYQTIRKYGIYQHQQVHKSREELILAPCSLCPYKGRTKYHLRQHLNTHHNPNTKMYSCKECSYQSKVVQYMKRHNLIHMNDKDITFYSCDSCDFKAKKKGRLKAHFNSVHVAKLKKLYDCDHCGLQFKKKGFLSRHILTHE